LIQAFNEEIERDRQTDIRKFVCLSICLIERLWQTEEGESGQTD